MFIGALFFIVSCQNSVIEPTYIISFSTNIKIINGTEYIIDSVKFKHSSEPYHNTNFLSASEVIYFESENREFVSKVPSNFIAKELYHDLNKNDIYKVWHKGGELTLLGKFYLKRKDGKEIIFKAIKNELPFEIHFDNTF